MILRGERERGRERQVFEEVHPHFIPVLSSTVNVIMRGMSGNGNVCTLLGKKPEAPQVCVAGLRLLCTRQV